MRTSNTQTEADRTELELLKTEHAHSKAELQRFRRVTYPGQILALVAAFAFYILGAILLVAGMSDPDSTSPDVLLYYAIGGGIAAGVGTGSVIVATKEGSRNQKGRDLKRTDSGGSSDNNGDDDD